MFNHKFAFAVAGVFLLTALNGCAARKNEISYAEEVDFSQLKHFAIRAPNQAQTSEQQSQRFIEALANSLQQKGFTLVAPEKADWVVNHYTYRESEKNNKSLSIGLGTGSRSRNSSISIGGVFQLPLGKPVSDYQSIQIDMLVDDKIIWQGNGAIEIEPGNIASMREVPKELVDKVLADFPPTK